MHKALEVYEGVLQIPSDMTTIPEGFCAGREDIRQILLPQSIYSIGPEAFSECTALEEVIFPEELLFVSPAAFLNCTALKKVTFTGSAPTIGEGAFSKVTATVTYPGGDSSWTAAKRVNYGGTLTWVAG